MANRKETIRITKTLNTIFNNNKFLTDLCNLCNNNYNAVLFSLGDILEYYITSRNTKVLSLEEMNIVIGLFKYIGNNKDYEIINIKDGESPEHALRRNIIKDGYMTRTINSYFLKRIKSYGLGNTKNIDLTLNKELDYLESVFGKNQYSTIDTLLHNEFCMSTPGANTFYNAGSSSPKRFFIGILGQDINDLLPMLVGEAKSSYFRRVLLKKIHLLQLDKKALKNALKTGDKVIKKLCKSNPSILLIPINSDLYSLKVTKDRNSNYDIMPINDWIFLKLMNESPMKFFARDFGDANEDLGNIIAYDTIVPFKELGVLSVPDRYEIIQLIAKNKGYKKNTPISYLTGLQIEENNEIKK